MIHSIYYTHVLVPLRILSITLSYPFQLLLAWYQNDYFCVLCAATELKRIIHKSVATLPYFSISEHTRREKEKGKLALNNNQMHSILIYLNLAIGIAEKN